jgi:hypothetical protein
MKDFREFITFDIKCALCKRKKGNHRATTFHCPIGSRGRANSYSFSTTQKFEPMMPKLPASVKKLLDAFDVAAYNAGCALVTDDLNQEKTEQYVAARYALQAHLNSLFYPMTKVKL